MIIYRPPSISRLKVCRNVLDEEVDSGNRQHNQDQALERPSRVDVGRTPGRRAHATLDWFVVIVLFPHFLIAEEERLHLVSIDGRRVQGSRERGCCW